MATSPWSKRALAVVAFLIAAAGGGTSGVILGNALVTQNFTPGHLPNPTQQVVHDLPFTIDVYASGSTLKTTGSDGKAGAKYAAACAPNPLYNVGVNASQTTSGHNSGTLLRLTYHNISNPNAVGGDIAFVNNCLDNGTGSSLAIIIDNTCTATGCVSRYTAGTADWHGAKYIKFGLRAAPNAAFKARITGRVEDNLGE